MSVSKETTIWCDAEDCDEWVQVQATAEWIRNALGKSGWVTAKGGKDFCNIHRGEAKR